jgi:tRNA/rRNA methyltransferase/tRNA (cytidine32/uridine32-2'-O)-methyltransferase
VEIPVRIVLVETSHPGNIGAVARAMKTMGLDDLALVSPRHFPHAEATARASGADDVLERASVADSLPEAVGDCGYVVGASARTRGGRWPVVDSRQCAGAIVRRLPAESVAIVMGPEQSGLTNEDLARCHALVHIPTAPEYGSLNLAMAVQVLCYELRMAALARAEGEVPVTQPEQREAPPATQAEVEGFHEQLEELLSRTGFLHPDHPRELKRKLRRMFMRAELDRNEINILRGALKSLDPERSPRGKEPDG